MGLKPPPLKTYAYLTPTLVKCRLKCVMFLVSRVFEVFDMLTKTIVTRSIPTEVKKREIAVLPTVEKLLFYVYTYKKQFYCKCRTCALDALKYLKDKREKKALLRANEQDNGRCDLCGVHTIIKQKPVDFLPIDINPRVPAIAKQVDFEYGERQLSLPDTPKPRKDPKTQPRGIYVPKDKGTNKLNWILYLLHKTFQSEKAFMLLSEHQQAHTYNTNTRISMEDTLPA